MQRLSLIINVVLIQMKEVVRNESLKVFEASIIYAFYDSKWASPIHCLPKNKGLTIVHNENNEIILQKVVTLYMMYIQYRKLNKVTRKDILCHFIDQIL